LVNPDNLVTLVNLDNLDSQDNLDNLVTLDNPESLANRTILALVLNLATLHLAVYLVPLLAVLDQALNIHKRRLEVTVDQVAQVELTHSLDSLLENNTLQVEEDIQEQVEQQLDHLLELEVMVPGQHL